MTLHHLEVFVAVCQEKTMHAAAEKLNQSQPSISKIISDLEKYYQIKLFERINHRLYLTPIGETMLDHARHILECFHHMEEDISIHRQTDHIRIGGSVSVGTCLIPPLLQRLTQQELPISYDVTVDNTSKIEQLVNDYELDLGLVEGCVNNPNLIVQDVADDELVLAVSSSHPLAGKPDISFHDLEQYPFVTREDGSSSRNQLELHLQQAGLKLTSNYACTSVEAIKQALLYTDSMAALSRMMIAEETKKGVFSILPLPDMQIKRSIRLIYHKNKYMSPAMKLFIKVLKDHVQERSHNTTA